MSQARTKKRPWRPKPSDAPPKPRGKIRLPRLEPDPKVQKCPQKSQTKADVSQLAGFLKKPSSSETTIATTGEKSTCNMSLATKPESRASNVTMATSGTCYTRKPSDIVNTLPKASSGVQSGIRSERGTDLGPDTKPVCVKANRKSSPQIELDDDFDYNLDLMGDYITISSKKPTPFWFDIECNAINGKLPAKQSTPDNIKTDLCGRPSSDTLKYQLVKQFTPETGRGVKRKISFDDDHVVPVPCKRSRTC